MGFADAGLLLEKLETKQRRQKYTPDRVRHNLESGRRINISIMHQSTNEQDIFFAQRLRADPARRLPPRDYTGARQNNLIVPWIQSDPVIQFF